MNRIHIVPGLDIIGNGMSVAAHLIADATDDELIDAFRFARSEGDINAYDEVWVHSCWLPAVFKSCRRVLKSGKPLVCMPHGNLDPVRLRYHAWKKHLVGPIERWCLRRCNRIVATCEAEKGWIENYLGKHSPPVEVTDIKRFFRLPQNEKTGQTHFIISRPLHLLYLGRRHPLKGLEYLEEAVKGIEGVELRVVSNAFGEEKEKVWEWCDVLVLPTLSENFGLVIAEALERGKRVITTDGAPAWGSEESDNMEMLPISNSNNKSEAQIWEGYDGKLLYLKGYRDGTKEKRINLLSDAIMDIMSVIRF